MKFIQVLFGYAFFVAIGALAIKVLGKFVEYNDTALFVTVLVLAVAFLAKFKITAGESNPKYPFSFTVEKRFK